MSIHFFDTSAFFKHYHSEKGSDRVNVVFSESDAIFVSELAIVEFASALKRLSNEGGIDKAAMDSALARFDNDIAGDIIPIPFDQNSTRVARDLVLQHSLRSLDALQLEAALSIRDMSPIFVSADERLVQAAQANGLSVLNPVSSS